MSHGSHGGLRNGPGIRRPALGDYRKGEGEAMTTLLVLALVLACGALWVSARGLLAELREPPRQSRLRVDLAAYKRGKL